MSLTKGMPKAQIELSGSRYDVRYDIDSMAEIEITAQALSLNVGRSSFYNLLDAPYNIREQIVMIHAGINGAKRYNEQKDLLDIDATKKLLQSHFEWIKAQAYDLKAWQESIIRLNGQIQEAARLGAGLVPPSMSQPEPVAKKKSSATD